MRKQEHQDKETLPQLLELENFFSTVTIPQKQFKLNSFITVCDCQKAIESHLQTAKLHNKKNKTVNLTFLKQLKHYLQK
jgi:hypothetical protein